ncbi:hypothetical protein ACFLZQ_03670 [Thermodesulfobacteriota bacterium]
MVETKKELRVKKGISGESTKKAATPFRIAAYIYGAEGRIGRNINDIGILLESICIFMH